MKTVVILVVALAFSASAFGQAWSGILPANRATDWTQAGIPGGIPSRSTICATITAGSSASTIQTAANSCPAGQVVLLSNGSYTLTSTVVANKGIVFRGQSKTGVSVTCSGGSCFYIGLNGNGGQGGTFPTNAFTVHSWTGGLTAGSTVLTLNSTTGITAGQSIDLDELNPAWVFTNGVEGNCLTGNSCGRNSNGTQFFGDASRAAPQMVHVVSVNAGANQITISAPGVAFDHVSGLTPQTFSWVCNAGCAGGNPNAFGGNVVNGGVENMTINCNNNDFCVSMPYCDYCWIKNLELNNIARAGVFFWWEIGSEIRDSYISSTAAGAPTQYGMEVMASAQVLIENNICYNVTSCLLPESNYGLVAAYNYALNAVAGNLFASYTSHLAHSYLSLYEGDVVDTLSYDNSWGSASHNTIFRSRPGGTGLNKNNFRVAVKINGQQHYENVVASVIGNPTFHAVYECNNANVGTEQNTDNFEYDLGFWNACNLGNAGAYDTVTESSLMRWGNWDAVTWLANGSTNGIRFCTGSGAGNSACTAAETSNADPTFPGLASPSTTFPPSFFTGVSAAHASCGTGLDFWKNPSSGFCPAYPPIGPDVACTTNCIANTASHATMIPAQLCYNSTAKDGNGFLTAFDANACYAADAALAGVATPTFSPVDGTYAFTQSVAISSTTASATICYTTDGTAPMANGAGTCTHGTTLANGGTVSVASSITVQALGTLSGSTDSAVGSATYTIGTPVASLTPSSLSFGGINISNSSASQTLTLQNTGTAVMSITSISLTGANTGDFFQSNSCPVGSTLGNGSSCTITVTFTPLAAGARSASVSVVDGASGSPHTSTLSGTGVQASIASKMSAGARISGRVIVK